MDIRKLQRAIVDGLEDVKAQHIAVFNTEHLSSMFERVIIASGTSNRQTKALAASVRDAVKSRGMQVMSTEGEDNGEWIIVDCGAAVAHIMQPAIRDYYHLEEIWGGKSVRIKIGATEHKLVKASEPEPAPKPAAKAASKAGSGAAPKKSAPRPPSLKTPKTAARKTAAKAPPRSAETKAENQAAAYKRVAAKKAPSRAKVTTVVASRKTPPRKTTARKVPR